VSFFFFFILCFFPAPLFFLLQLSLAPHSFLFLLVSFFFLSLPPLSSHLLISLFLLFQPFLLSFSFIFCFAPFLILSLGFFISFHASFFSPSIAEESTGWTGCSWQHGLDNLRARRRYEVAAQSRCGAGVAWFMGQRWCSRSSAVRLQGQRLGQGTAGRQQRRGMGAAL
jgi:hypothetical protein